MLEKNTKSSCGVDDHLYQSIKDETKYWRQVLQRILDVTLFISERGLAFRGSSALIGDSDNGNFLGILELLGRYDPIMAKHLATAKKGQEDEHKKYSQTHYLSKKS